MKYQGHESGGWLRPRGHLLAGPPAYRPRTPWQPGWALLATVGIVGASGLIATVLLSLWQLGMESLQLSALSALDRVKAGGAPSSALGEGLADALNVGGY